MNEPVKISWFGLHRDQTIAQIFFFFYLDFVNFQFMLFLVTFLILILTKYKKKFDF